LQGSQMPESERHYSVSYVGANPESLDAQELIQTLSAFARISTKAGQTAYGPQASFRITHVQPGSINIEGFIEIVAGLQPAFALLPIISLGIGDVAELIKKWLDLLKFLKGKPPKVIEKVENGNAVQIENANGDTTIVNGNVYNTFMFNNVSHDAAKLHAPTKRGATKLELYKEKQKIGTYDAQDLAEFRPIKPTTEPIESEIDALLEVIAPVFEGEGVWRFRYGRRPLTARLTDDSYRQQVAEGQESFRHGDSLKVRLKTVQEKVGNKISTKHFITKVLGRV
jgi:hypothetical protein